jgi:hypothetical protein
MDRIVFNNKTFNLAVNGVSVTTDTLILTIASDDFDRVESACAPVEEIVQKLEDGTKVASYIGYTKLVSVNKMFHQIVDYDHESREEQRPKVDPETGEYVIDPETGEIETETTIVTIDTPIYANTIVVTLFQPTLEDIVSDQGEQITEIQEIIDELLEA